jgi:hypothetical protein
MAAVAVRLYRLPHRLTPFSMASSARSRPLIVQKSFSLAGPVMPAERDYYHPFTGFPGIETDAADNLFQP